MRNEIEDLLSRVAVRLDVDFLPASSRTSKGDCDPFTRGKSCSDLMSTFKTMKIYSGFSKICGRLSPITRFVHHLGAFLDIDGENIWRNEWRTMNNNTKR